MRPISDDDVVAALIIGASQGLTRSPHDYIVDMCEQFPGLEVRQLKRCLDRAMLDSFVSEDTPPPERRRWVSVTIRRGFLPEHLSPIHKALGDIIKRRDRARSQGNKDETLLTLARDPQRYAKQQDRVLARQLPSHLRDPASSD